MALLRGTYAAGIPGHTVHGGGTGQAGAAGAHRHGRQTAAQGGGLPAITTSPFVRRISPRRRGDRATRCVAPAHGSSWHFADADPRSARMSAIGGNVASGTNAALVTQSGTAPIARLNVMSL